MGMEGNGPTSGTPRPIGCILAGHSPHAVDLLCARLIGMAGGTGSDTAGSLGAGIGAKNRGGSGDCR